MGHRIVWFDIPVTDLVRAVSFYSKVLDIEIYTYGEDVPVAVMEHSGDDVAGCLFTSKDAQPSDKGPLLYFTVEGRLGEAAGLVESLGGQVLEPPHEIPPNGNRCVVLDSEGNRICLHSNA